MTWIITELELRSPGGGPGRPGGLCAACSSSLGSGSSEPEPGGGSAVLPGLARPVPHHLGVDGAADAVGQLSVKLGQLVAAVYAGVGDVPHGGGLHNVPDENFLMALSLGQALAQLVQRMNLT